MKSSRMPKPVTHAKRDVESAADDHRRGEADVPRNVVGSPDLGSPAAIVALQRTVGNRAVVGFLDAARAGDRTPAVTRGSDPRAIQRFPVYRAGGATINNMTPKMKDTTGAKKGLSTFEDPLTAPIKIAKAQVIETDNLAAPLSALRNGKGGRDTHVSILPATDEDLIDWAGGKHEDYSQNVLDAKTSVWTAPKETK